MKNITRTIWGADLQTNQLAGLQYTTPVNSTLNELFNIQAGVQPATGQSPSLGYLIIGNGAHFNASGANGFPLTLTKPHRSTDAGLYNPIPFAMRPLASDFTSSEMAKYALRVVKTINGVQYACYYARRIDKTGLVTARNYNTVANGVTTTTPYVATSSNLNPVPPTVSPTGVVTTSADYLTVALLLNLGFDANDVQEFINAVTILYGSAQYAIISEMAACSGLDKAAQGVGASGSFNYNEAIAVQAHSFITTTINVSDSDVGFNFTVDMGAAEPLLSVTSGTSTSGTTTTA